VLLENRNGLAVNCCVTAADGHAEPQAAVAMVEEIPGQHRVTLGADKGYDRKDFAQELRDHQVTPHIARKQTSIIDDRTTRHPGYAISQQKRKTVAGLRKTRHRGNDFAKLIERIRRSSYQRSIPRVPRAQEYRLIRSRSAL
jgi:IS5 family transposase